MKSPLSRLQEYGQSIWLDTISRQLIVTGDFQRLVEEDNVSGVTSNPTIFDKAIEGSAAYDQALLALLAADPAASTPSLLEKLEIQDIQMAADILRPVYDHVSGADGFASIEVSPRLAHDTAGSIAEARRLWTAVNRPNLMIKIPATEQGIHAVEVLTAEGINVNITLMFSQTHYEKVAQAYLRGLERNPQPNKVISVASFFISRVDTEVDRALQTIGTPDALSLCGKIGIANAKLIYRRFREIFMGTAFAKLKTRGANLQRPLWASTGTKNPAYSDIMYIEQLIGPHTINTMPITTLRAFRDHGRPAATLEAAVKEAEETLLRLAGLGIEVAPVTEKLLDDGLSAFLASLTRLQAAVEEKRKFLLSSRKTA